jgi:hypothetical protein
MYLCQCVWCDVPMCVRVMWWWCQCVCVYAYVMWCDDDDVSPMCDEWMMMWWCDDVSMNDVMMMSSMYAWWWWWWMNDDVFVMCMRLRMWCMYVNEWCDDDWHCDNDCVSDWHCDCDCDNDCDCVWCDVMWWRLTLRVCVWCTAYGVWYVVCVPIDPWTHKPITAFRDDATMVMMCYVIACACVWVRVCSLRFACVYVRVIACDVWWLYGTSSVVPPQNRCSVAPISFRHSDKFLGGTSLKFFKLTKSPVDLSKLPRGKSLFFLNSRGLFF